MDFANYAKTSHGIDIGALLQRAETDDTVLLSFLFILSAWYLFQTATGGLKNKHDHLWYEIPQESSLQAGGEKATRNIATKLDQMNKDVVIFFGSQSGTAESFANRLSRDCQRLFRLPTLVADLQDYDSESIAKIPHSKFAILILSTYGEGDPSDNAASFFSWAQSNKTANLSNLRYMALGLGNSNYKYYNKVVDVVTEFLQSAQATALMPTYRADDAVGATEEDFTNWKGDLFQLFQNKLGYEQRPNVYEPTIKITEDGFERGSHLGQPLPSKHEKNAVGSIQKLEVISARKLLVTSERDSLHVEIDINEFPELKYKTGDHLVIWPTNPVTEVNRLINSLGIESRKSTPLHITSVEEDVQHNIPTPTTFSALFSNYLEICAPVGREAFLTLAQFAPTPEAKEQITTIGSNQDTYALYCASKHVNFGRVLEDFATPTATWNLPLSCVLELIPLLTPRYYSISSSSIVSPKRISITVSAPSSLPSQSSALRIPGLTTNYLLSIAADPKYTILESTLVAPTSGESEALPIDQNHRVYAQIRKSKFRMPVTSTKPVIMVASGSGIAPFRAFIQERARLVKMGRDVGQCVLFFGCRSSAEYLYSEELAQLQSDLGEKLKIVTAFSREHRSADGGKMYVQEKIVEEIEEVCELLMEQEACFYICGSAGMAREVGRRLYGSVRESQGWSEKELEGWKALMKRTHRWQEDVWG